MIIIVANLFVGVLIPARSVESPFHSPFSCTDEDSNPCI